MINRINIKKSILSIVLILTAFLYSCSNVSKNDYQIIKNAVEKSNSENLYKATFVLEVKDVDTEDLVTFVQGNYSIDKSKKNYKTVIMNGELVQTVFNTPSSFKMAFYDNTYVTLSNNYKVLTDLDEKVLLQQFMCSPAFIFNLEDIESIEASDVSEGVMYNVFAENCDDEYFINLLGDDLYSFSSMKQPQKDLTKISNINYKYVISKDGVLKSRETTYTVIAYDTVPYFPGHQATNEDYKRTFSVSLNLNYKSFEEDVSVDISDFLQDESQTESQGQ